MLHFHALEVKSITMDLPVRLMCGRTHPAHTLDQSVIVSAVSLETRLSASASSIDFGPCIVLARNRTPPPPLKKHVTITNKQDKPIAWSFGGIHCHDNSSYHDVFRLEKNEGILEPRAWCCIPVRAFRLVYKHKSNVWVQTQSWCRCSSGHANAYSIEHAQSCLRVWWMRQLHYQF